MTTFDSNRYNSILFRITDYLKNGEPGYNIVVVGPGGCGKTTLYKSLKNKLQASGYRWRGPASDPSSLLLPPSLLFIETREPIDYPNSIVFNFVDAGAANAAVDGVADVNAGVAADHDQLWGY